MRDAFGIERGEISKSVARGVGQIQNMSTRVVARTGHRPQMALRAKQAQNGMKQVETPSNAARKVTDAKNALTSRTKRTMATEWPSLYGANAR
jgi:hypothetical protein